ncbi:MAG: hypothetical protein GY873_39170 [Bosea sp.]|uniref:hypothetical protein n=1 Tax=Bosea sp. (in: a-proteobacteria) TaxID=1871050 RepID=UPI002398B29A|nr:hypothetical protein [Bosea sp. (in: a-proteobacteria)]MCP4740226.1 hypothetical protein [Bosea sp. (in: a-proteobacteria)]
MADFSTVSGLDAGGATEELRAMETKLRQVRALCAWHEAPDSAVRLGCALIAGTQGDWAMARTQEMAALVGAARASRITHDLRHLAERGIIDADAKPGLAVAVRIILAGEPLTQELDSLARRLREARRGRHDGGER